MLEPPREKIKKAQDVSLYFHSGITEVRNSMGEKEQRFSNEFLEHFMHKNIMFLKQEANAQTH